MLDNQTGTSRHTWLLGSAMRSCASRACTSLCTSVSRTSLRTWDKPALSPEVKRSYVVQPTSLADTAADKW